jgi:radical SAM protein with 4Fe4S-binding SPASM domain
MPKKGIMRFGIFKKVVSDIKEFDKPIKTLRLYAFGEPLLNPWFAEMVRLAKHECISEDIDTTTNGTILNPRLNRQIIEAGIDRINISVMGMNADQYEKFSLYRIDFEKYVSNIADLYHNRGDCVVFIKINGDAISEDDQKRFVDTFGPISDGFAIEHIMNCWHDFDMHGVERNQEVGVYGQPLTRVEVCPYIFYSFCVNFDGEVSACFLDWNRRLVVGNIEEKSLKEIWNGDDLKTLRALHLMKRRSMIPPCKDCNQLEAGEPVNIDDLAEELLRKL